MIPTTKPVDRPPPHALRPLGPKKMARIQFDVVDSESRIGEEAHAFRLASSASSTSGSEEEFEVRFEVRSWASKRQLWSWLAGRATRSTRWVIMHSAPFDMQNTSGYIYIPEAGYELKKHFSRGTTHIERWNGKRGGFLILDTMNWYGGRSLEDLAPQVGEKKLLFGCEKDPAAWNALPDDKIRKRCESDAVITAKLFRKLAAWFAKMESGNMPLTASQMAMQIFTHRYLNRVVYIHGDRSRYDAAATALEREAYRGGGVRVDAFGGPFLNHYKLDMHAAYPAIGAKYPVPVRMLFYEPAGSVELVRRLRAAGVLVIAKATFNIPPGMNAIGIRTKTGLDFLEGEGLVQGLVTSEIDFLLEHGLLTGVGELAAYQGAVIFGGFVRDMNLMQALDPENRLFYKLMMDGIFGKFGQLTSVAVRARDWDDEERYGTVNVTETGKPPRLIRFINGQAMEVRREYPSFHSFPAISAEVTGRHRIRMWEIRKKCNDEGRVEKGPNLKYSDNDDVILEDPWPLYPLIGTEVGQFVPEAFGDFTINAKKDYSWTGLNLRTMKHEDTTILKGIPRPAALIAPNTYRWRHNVKINESLRKQNPPVQVRVETQTRTVSRLN